MNRRLGTGLEAAFLAVFAAGEEANADLSPVTLPSAAAVIAGLLFVPPAIWQATGFDWSEPSARDWAALCWWGAGTMGLGSVLWPHGMRRVSGTTASAFMAVMPVSALLLSYLLLDEGFAWPHSAGMAAVLAALAVVTYRDARSDG
jgi:drug/metabolite transporter (DMT)-like permease